MPRPTEFHNRLAGKVAMVTGAGGSPAGDGIGSAIAELFAAEGAKVAIVNRDPERAEYVRGAIERAGGEAIITHAEVTDDAACRAAVEATVEAFGRLDVLVNNAAIVDPRTDRLDTMDVADWDRSIDVNLKGPMLMARNAVRPMMAQGSGSIINIGSIAAVRSTNGAFAYGPAKAGMLSLTRDIAVSYGRHGIRCNTLVVGSVHTPIFVAAYPKDDPIVDVLRERRRRIGPLGIQGDSWDIAGPALFLAGDEARFISGTELVVDAGQIAASPSLVPMWLAD
jgi:NAD(P)-dependent dehydrogenase (short-subunit alcohol dehydrogenase family)